MAVENQARASGDDAFANRAHSLLKAMAIDATVDLIRTAGWANIRMTDIAAKIGVSKPTLYRYFRNKEEMLTECIRKSVEMIDGAIAELAGEEHSSRDRLEAALRRYAEIMTMDFGMCVVRIGESELPPGSRRTLRAHERKTDRIIRNLIAECVEDGSVDVPDVRLAAFTILGALNRICRWYNPSGPLSPQEIADQCTRILFDGLASRAPRKTAARRDRPVEQSRSKYLAD